MRSAFLLIKFHGIPKATVFLKLSLLLIVFLRITNENVGSIMQVSYYEILCQHRSFYTFPLSVVYIPFYFFLCSRIERHIHRGWEEAFGVLRIIANVAIIFILELFKFLLVTFVQKLVIGLIVLMGDYFLKPVLSNLFNSLIQPVFIFILNLFLGLKRLLRPVTAIIGDVLEPVTNLLKSFRLFEYKNQSHLIKDV